ncbi:MAG: MFS transporter [Acidimicrobiia bacterium]
MRALRSPLLRPLVATVLVATTGVLPGFLTGALGVRIREDLDFGETGLGFAIGLSFLAAATCSALFGRTAERLGPVRSMRASSLGSAMSMLALAVFARSITSLTTVLVVAGMANAMTQPATNLYIARAVPVRRHGLAFAIKQSAIPGATLLGGLAVPTIALTVGWRWAYVGGAAIALAGGALAIDVGDTAPSAGRPIGRRDQSLRTLAVLGTGVGFGALAAASLGSFSTSALDEAGISEGTAGLLASIGSLLVMTIRLWLGAWSDRTARSHVPVVGAMVLVGALGWAVMGIMTPVALVAGGLLAYVFGWGWPGLFNLAIARANPSAPAAASGVTQTGTYLGVAIGPFVFGVLAEHLSYSVAWNVAAGSAVLAAVCIAVGDRMSPTPQRATVLLHERGN